MVLRRLMETLIIELYSRRGWSQDVQDPGTNEFMPLKALIDKLNADGRLHMQRRTIDGLNKVKEVVDTAAHDFRIKIRKSDLDKIQSAVRLTCDRLILQSENLHRRRDRNRRYGFLPVAQYITARRYMQNMQVGQVTAQSQNALSFPRTAPTGRRESGRQIARRPLTNAAFIASSVSRAASFAASKGRISARKPGLFSLANIRCSASAREILHLRPLKILARSTRPRAPCSIPRTRRGHGRGRTDRVPCCAEAARGAWLPASPRARRLVFPPRR